MNCTNHTNRIAHSFCFKCGNWYCNECLTQNNSQFLCKSCANYREKSNLINFNDILKNKKIGVILKLFSGILLLIFFLAGLLIHPIFYIFSISSIFIFLLSLLFQSKKKSKLNSNYSRITNAQVFALLDRYKQISTKKLAESTNSTELAAKKKLNQLVLDNILEITSDDLTIIYTKK